METLSVTVDRNLGTIIVSGEGSIETLTHAINLQLISKVRYFPSHTLPGMKGKVKAFSFHWSNAQAAWDVISVRESSWSTDGAEFILYSPPQATSPLGKPWTLKEMQYVAKKLLPHPGFANAFR